MSNVAGKCQTMQDNEKYGRIIAEVEYAGHDVGGRKTFQEAQLSQR